MKTFFTKKTWFLLLTLALCGSITAQTKMSNHPENQQKQQIKELRQITEVWDVLYAFDYTEVADIDGFFAPFYWEGNLYISRWDATAEDNEPGKIYKFVMTNDDWIFDKAFVIPDVVGDNNFEGFTSDGSYIYGVNETEFIYQIDPTNWTVASKIEVTSSPISIAYDPNKNGFWIAEFIDFSAVFVGMDGLATGETLTFDNEEMYIAGLAYDNVSEGGPYLWTSCYTDLHRWNMNSSEFEYNVHSILDVQGVTEGDWNSNIYLYQDINTDRFVFLGLDEESYLVYAYDFDVSPNAIVKHDDSFKLYPNPSSDVLKVSGTGIQKLEVYNSAGQLMEEKTNDLTFINVSSYFSGVYNLIIYCENNKKYTKKIIVSK